MYILYTTYDDGFYDIMDIETGEVRVFNTTQAINFRANNEVMGLSVSNGKINYSNTYGFRMFVSEDEMDEFIKEDNIQYSSKEYIYGYWYVFYRSYNNIHVDYVIWHYTEVETKYLATKGTSADIRYAKVFDRDTAYKVMNQRNNALAKKYNLAECGFWTVKRVVNR